MWSVLCALWRCYNIKVQQRKLLILEPSSYNDTSKHIKIIPILSPDDDKENFRANVINRVFVNNIVSEVTEVRFLCYIIYRCSYSFLVFYVEYHERYWRSIDLFYFLETRRIVSQAGLIKTRVSFFKHHRKSIEIHFLTQLLIKFICIIYSYFVISY